MEKVRLLGMWASPFCWRVEWALKLKGVEYEYVEVDLENKPAELLQHNPVYRKVPVLFHNGKTIAESVVILEYIDETWKQNPLLPSDPYLRSMARFWARFFDVTLIGSAATCIRSTGEDQATTFQVLFDNLRSLENGLVRDFGFGSTSLQADRVGFLDLVIGPVLSIHRVTEEVTGVQMLDRHRYPVLMKWLDALKEDPTLTHFLTLHEKLVQYVRAKNLASSPH